MITHFTKKVHFFFNNKRFSKFLHENNLYTIKMCFVKKKREKKERRKKKKRYLSTFVALERPSKTQPLYPPQPLMLTVRAHCTPTLTTPEKSSLKLKSP